MISRRKMIAKIMLNRGLRKLIAVASVNTINPAAANMPITPPSPKRIRPICNSQGASFTVTPRITAMGTMVQAPKKNRAQET